MPEGHSVHRIARQFSLHFVGRPVAVSSPQGRFSAGAEKLDGHTMVDALAVGKQMFLEFDHGLWLRVHLGLYGAWDFAGDITADATVASAGGRMGQTNQRGTVAELVTGHDLVVPGAAGSRGENEASLHSIGAPRRTRLRMSESERQGEDIEEFPPPPIGQVRVRLLTTDAVADLRGPTACEVQTPDEVAVSIGKLGPDPLVGDPAEGEERFVAAVRKKATPIGLLLMDQSVVSGIGNVYRAELLFRARLDPYTPGKLVPEEVVRNLWRDWAHLLSIGVETGQMMTMDGLEGEAYVAALASRDDRHWVYHREGQPCRVCGTHITMAMAAARKLYWCPNCQR
ncbi:Fpg/Nei family DNA glycosylase [Salinibacterium hongtaonis]|uniref:Fpg/Nei family DNA glycosylase n=1 Tax=Homoserinimonas hongtaonis TaxID=2079791 RepID=UPI000D37106D|nr:DNA-formamidopyrimidine glycosylase family protein [Salinibacterium hongtaonis]AWB89498.1 DNA glycosylase [Salinibacterium hongtaonis]